MSDTEVRRLGVYKLFLKKPPGVKQNVFFQKVAKKTGVSCRTIARYWRQLKVQADAQNDTKQGEIHD
jgi:uncharacterized protein YerC